MYKICKEYIEFEFYFPDFEDVILNLYDSPDASSNYNIKLEKTSNNYFYCRIGLSCINSFYNLRVFYLKGNNIFEKFLVDPYSFSTIFQLDYLNPRFSQILNTDFNWGNDIQPLIKYRDLIIYETHIRDISAHDSSLTIAPGTYLGFIESNSKGGLNYIKELGINAVEFLPVFDFSYMETPFRKQYTNKFNTWNPYEKNHWGYMTSNYFSPTSLYSHSPDEIKKMNWMGMEKNSIIEFKNIVKELHKNKIAVILDVVYNHFSEYEMNDLRNLGIDSYFRINESGNLSNDSFCGNDLNTSDKFIQHIIIESLKFWINEYHIDGFRFDLGNIIDNETLNLITKELRRINPNVILIAEPWGGGYDPEKFSNLEWLSWNDQFRNGIKGENPYSGLGWIFGKYYGNTFSESIQNFITGSNKYFPNGFFNDASHSVNYLESHDGYTLSDFIRIATGYYMPHTRISNNNEFAKLDKKQLKYNKLAALILFISSGAIMIHSGQEVARTKIIEADTLTYDPEVGFPDHNSYNKDNNTNYINFNLATINKLLLDYYKGLVQIRKTFKAFCEAQRQNYYFHQCIYSEFIISFELSYLKNDFYIILNADQTLTANIELPYGEWGILADSEKTYTTITKTVKEVVSVPAISGMILIKLN